MWCVLDLPDDILEHIAAQFGFMDTRTIRMMETAHPVFSRRGDDGLSVCSHRCKVLFESSLTETRFDPEMSWMDNLVECKYDMCADLCGAAYKLRPGRILMPLTWRQGKRALYGAFSLKDYAWLSRNIGPMIENHLVTISPETYRSWNRLEQGHRLRFQYEESIYLMIDNCLQAIHCGVRPRVFARHLNSILQKRPSLEQECREAAETRRKVVLYYQKERKNYCVPERHAKWIKLE